MSAGYRYVLLDVFTDTALEGNQLAVFPEAPELPAGEMQRLARELNLSETVFVRPARRGGDAHVRIFTPAAELPFAGHPVLGSAIVVGSERGLA
ncbi:MAG: PhzF family phenazine biosynthesis isomerase, partial [Solirubrobacteraceae bacterium]